MSHWRSGVALAWALVFVALAVGALVTLRLQNRPGLSDDAVGLVALGLAGAGLVAVALLVAADARRVHGLVVRAGRVTDGLAALRGGSSSEGADPVQLALAARDARPVLDDLRAVGEASAARDLADALRYAPVGQAAGTGPGDADERSSSRGRAFWAQVALALVASGSLGSIGGAYVTAEQTGSVASAEQAFRQQQAIDAVQCDDVERDAVEDITADTRDRPDYWASVVLGDEIDDYSSATERAACPTLRVDIIDRLEDLPAPR